MENINMPKINPNYLKDAILEYKKETKRKGRDPQGRSYVSSPECRMLRALLLETLDQGKQMLTTLHCFIQRPHLEKIIHELTPIIAYDLGKRYPELSYTQRDEQAKQFSHTFVRNYSDTCHYYGKKLTPQIRAVAEIRQKFIQSEKPLSYLQRGKIRVLRFETVPLCHHLMSEWTKFTATIMQNKEAMRQNKPLDRLGILKFNELVQHGTRKI